MSLCDVYDALRSRRPYKEPFSHVRAMDIILNGDGRTHPNHFDPAVLAAFKRISNKFADIFDSHHEEPQEQLEQQEQQEAKPSRNTGTAA